MSTAVLAATSCESCRSLHSDGRPVRIACTEASSERIGTGIAQAANPPPADPCWTTRQPGFTVRNFMSALFFKRFLQKPFQIASIIPSSRALVERVASKMDFSQPRIIAEYGPGEGVHSRELASRMDAAVASLPFRTGPGILARPRAAVCRRSAGPRDQSRRRQPLRRTGPPRHPAVRLHSFRHSLQHSRDQKETRPPPGHIRCAPPGGAFIIYQVTNELRQHATFFDRAESEYCLQNIPPMFITVFQKAQHPQRTFAHAPATPSGLGHARGMTPARPGPKRIPWARCPSRTSALYGASTQRAVLNFPVSGWRFSRPVHPRARPASNGRPRRPITILVCSMPNGARSSCRRPRK